MPPHKTMHNKTTKKSSDNLTKADENDETILEKYNKFRNFKVWFGLLPYTYSELAFETIPILIGAVIYHINFKTLSVFQELYGDNLFESKMVVISTLTFVMIYSINAVLLVVGVTIFLKITFPILQKFKKLFVKSFSILYIILILSNVFLSLWLIYELYLGIFTFDFKVNEASAALSVKKNFYVIKAPIFGEIYEYKLCFLSKNKLPEEYKDTETEREFVYDFEGGSGGRSLVGWDELITYHYYCTLYKFTSPNEYLDFFKCYQRETYYKVYHFSHRIDSFNKHDFIKEENLRPNYCVSKNMRYKRFKGNIKIMAMNVIQIFLILYYYYYA